MESFALAAARKERFIRTIVNTHANFYLGRALRYREDERDLYKRLWDRTRADGYRLRELIRAIVTSPEYLNGEPPANERGPATIAASDVRPTRNP